MPDSPLLPPELMEALMHRRPPRPAMAPAFPALKVTLVISGETVAIPAVSPMGMNDEPAWRDHVEQMVALAETSSSSWFHQGLDIARSVLALREGERPGSPYLSRVLAGNLSSRADGMRPERIEPALQEGLVGLLIAQQVYLDKATIGEAATCANPHLLERVLLALETRQGLPNAWDMADGLSPLHHAARNHSSAVGQIIERLVKRGAAMNPIGTSSTTPLGEAVAVQNLAAVGAFLQHGADVNLCGVGRNPPLFDAIDRGDTELIHRLLKATAATVMASGQTAMERAAVYQGAFETVQCLMNEGLDPFPPSDPHDPSSPRSTALLDHLRAHLDERPSDDHRNCLQQLEGLYLRRALDEPTEPGLTPEAKARARL